MYSLETSLARVKGIGPALEKAFAARGLLTVKDVLLFTPLRYEDRSVKKKINELKVDELVTLEAEVTSASNYYKGRRSIQSATVKDETGRLKLMWFNNPHVIARLAKGTKWLISGKLNDRGVMTQPTVETYKEDSIHTGRLVPVYSNIPDVAPATFRRILKHILDNLTPPEDIITSLNQSTLSLSEALTLIHFPDLDTSAIKARERLALEEILGLIHHSQILKEQWKELGAAVAVPTTEVNIKLPFALTRAQQRSVEEVLKDIQETIPMNRLLVGDVGSGKTAVAGIACAHTLAAGHHAVLIAPTQILAEQHAETFQKLFPNLPLQLITARTSKQVEAELKENQTLQPTVFIGTHAAIRQLKLIQPALLIYDEQHRFGVAQRSAAQELTITPHILTLSATPIPRTLMLTLFSHLSLSVIDELPPGRQPVKTWLVSEQKRKGAYEWIAETLATNKQQALVVCPFIDPSESEALENVAAATQTFDEIKSEFKKTSLKVELLHGRIPKKDQAEITDRLYKREIDILVTTPIVEVGVDLPAASIILIEAAERFGLASLHQLRGRVGRAGQQAYCLLFTNSSSDDSIQRLKKFCEIHEGVKLAEMDMERRGAGDLFGTQQHGFDNLRFAQWTNLELVTQANVLYQQLKDNPAWQVFLPVTTTDEENIPLAN